MGCDTRWPDAVCGGAGSSPGGDLESRGQQPGPAHDGHRPLPLPCQDSAGQRFHLTLILLSNFANAGS